MAHTVQIPATEYNRLKKALLTIEETVKANVVFSDVVLEDEAKSILKGSKEKQITTNYLTELIKGGKVSVIGETPTGKRVFSRRQLLGLK
jgi:hypothetical protein